MPKFMYTILGLTAINWVILLLIIFNIEPNQFLILLVFLPLFFVAMSLTLSLSLYTITSRKFKKFRLFNDKMHFRNCSKWGLYFSAMATTFLLLRAIHFFNLISMILFVLIFGGVYWYFKKKVPSIW